ncbi:hypothetical protein BBJ28_00007792 [Nothophytophthora sp. Chile5]|nr:hypothetical protein BBJ28_00007792 [Nothophytophthora sp. Chile5]
MPTITPPPLQAKMDEQDWHRRGGARRPTASHAPPTAGKTRTTTIASSRAPAKTIARGGRPNAAGKSETAPSSRWRELRQSVRIKATLETDDHRPVDARIADLCVEDREKVSKLVRRLVEVGSLQEEGEKEFQRQRSVLEAEVQELRGQAKRDAEELEELSEALHSATRKTQMFQERVLVLEESTDAETRCRLDAEQTLDLLKLEVDKLRALVRRQQDEMQTKAKQQQERFDTELQQVSEELKDVQDLLLRERRERVQEKQKALQERLERSSVVEEAQVPPVVVVSTSPTPLAPQSGPAGASYQGPLDVSSFLNTSVELPEKIKEIMDDWKQRMEDALEAVSSGGNAVKTAAASRSEEEARGPVLTVSTACQTAASLSNSDESDDKRSDQMVESEQMEDSDDGDVAGGPQTDGVSSPAQAEQGFVTPMARQQRRHLRMRSIPKVKRLDFDQYIAALDSESEAAESEVAELDSSEGEGKVQSEEEGVRRPQVTRGGAVATRAVSHRHKQRTRVSHNDRRPSAVPIVGDDDAGTSILQDVDLLNAMNGESTQREFVQELMPSSAKNGSFGNIYEASLFDVVDAMERTQLSSASLVQKTQQQSMPSIPRRPSSLGGSYTQPTSSGSPSTRVEDLRQQMEARERALFRQIDAKQPQNQPGQTQEARHPLASSMDDLAVFEEVKDLYAEDLFTSRQWPSTTTSAATASVRRQQAPGQRETQAAISILTEDRYDGHGAQGLSTQELSVREAIERDMEALLRTESLQSLAASQY